MSTDMGGMGLLVEEVREMVCHAGSLLHPPTPAVMGREDVLDPDEGCTSAEHLLHIPDARRLSLLEVAGLPAWVGEYGVLRVLEANFLPEGTPPVLGVEGGLGLLADLPKPKR